VRRTRRRTPQPELRHLTVDVATGTGPLIAAVDEALAAGAVPAVPGGLVGRSARRRRSADGSVDPELWSTTA
jgi:uncharacterized protein